MKRRLMIIVNAWVKKKILFSLLFCFFTINSCATYHSYDRYSFNQFNKHDSSKYKKKVIILPIINDVNIKVSLLKSIINSALTNQITAKYPGIIITNYDTLCSDSLLPLFVSNFSEIDHSDLINFGRKEGLTSIIFQNIQDISISKRNIGFLWFKKNKCCLTFKVRITVLDVLTGTILCRHTKDVDSIEINNELVAENFILDDFKNLINHIEKNILFLKTINELEVLIGKSVQQQQWFSNIISTEDSGKVVIPVGYEVGIAEGDQFNVFCGDRFIHGHDKQVYCVPGQKIGRVTITKVDTKYSIGMIIDNSTSIPIGSIIIPLR